MKIWITLAIGVCFFIFLGFAEQSYLQKSSSLLDRELAQMEAKLSHHNWDEALHQLNKIETAWHEAQKWWALLTHHQEIDAVEQALVKTRESIIGKSYPDARMELGTLRHFIKHIAEREKLTLVNIF